ncbi:cellulose biosynthesis cyclic di-GMP-binding regulatory protein BcsB [Acidithiobacillus sp. IBUN Pt1247-S3]|uniref:cellulose biosynthesis cyclic di-GMP-binding regulatory protein BcsB n=1 Tax=Acidithiobacillus sp. IBUN Pt1247-S3 TaxID=3166642 RepID=UPI0034E48ACC
MKMRFGVIFLLVFWSAWAQATDSTAAATSSKHASAAASPAAVTGTVSTLAFATTIGNKEPIRLQGHGANVRVPFSLPYGEDVSSIQVSIQGNVSRQMAGSVSLEAISHGRIIEQMPLKPGGDLGTQFSIPTRYLDAGFHTLTLQLVGVAGDSKGNWIQIDPRGSNFQYMASPKAFQPRLDHLDWLFDRASLNYAPELAVYASPGSASLEPLAYVAQGVSLRYQFLPTRIDMHSVEPYVGTAPKTLDQLFSELPKGSRTAVIVGSADKISPILHQLAIGKIDAASILVRQFPDHVHHYLLIVTGENEMQVLRAARTFANTGLQYPPVSELAINGDDGAVEAGASALPLTTLPFSQSTFPLVATGFSTTTVNGFSGPVNVRIWDGGWQRDGELRLNLVYSAGMSGTSDVNVLFNGALEGSIPLNSASGGKYVKYAVSIPSTEAKPGWNTLTLVPNLIPASNHDFLFNAERANLQLSVFADSTFTWQGGDALRHLDLTSLSSAGILGLKKGERVNLFTSRHVDEMTMSAMLTLVGKIAQRYGTFFPIATSGSDNFDSGPILAVAPLTELPDSFREALGVEATGAPHTTWQFKRSLRNIVSNDPENQNGYLFSLGKQSLAFTSSYDGHPLLVFSAVDAPTLRAGLDSLIDFGLWPQLRGFTDWWQADGKTVHAIEMQDEPFHAFGVSGGIGVWISQHLWPAIIIFVLLAVFVSFLIYMMVRRRYHSLPPESQLRPIEADKERAK